MLLAINLDEYFEKLAEKSWVTIPTDLNSAKSLYHSAQNRIKAFRAAKITKAHLLNSNVRSDMIFWLDRNTENLSEDEISVLSELEKLQNDLRQYFRISLTEYECHYSLYQDGQSYAKHVDSTPENNKRVFSFVIYLNSDWKAEHGGQIVGFKNNQIEFKINPEIGTMILFRSDLEHEVLIAHRPRFALTGWIRQ